MVAALGAVDPELVITNLNNLPPLSLMPDVEATTGGLKREQSADACHLWLVERSSPSSGTNGF